MENNSISSRVKLIEDSLHKELDKLFKVTTPDDVSEVKTGYISDFADGVCHVIGLDNAKIGQKLKFPDSWKRAKNIEGDDEPEIIGLVVDVDSDSVGVIVFGEERFVKQGDKVEGLKDILQIPVTEKMLGRVIDPFGKPIDGKKAGHLEWLTENDEVKNGILCLPIERKAPGVIDRSKISEPFQTGIKSVDSMLPIGRGQRMLIIGDRVTGKTAIGIDAIVNQNTINRELNESEGNKSDSFDIHNIDTHDPRTVYCIYVAIGRKASDIKQLAKRLEDKKAMKYTIILAAMANDPASLLYLSPFSGTTIGEYFRDRGKHALIIYDDLSKHATAYRQISLLLRRPPGREAFPGDIFYLHSRLLERSSKIAGKQNEQLMNNDKTSITRDYKSILKPFGRLGIETYGGGSLTALPYIETKQNDYAAYIPTNVISITDGQVYLSDKLFNEGFKPSVNIGISVSRVGSKAQTISMKEVSDGLKGYLANYREKEKYTKFGINPTDEDLMVLDRGRLIMHFLKQPQYKPVPLERQIIGLFAVRKGYFDVLPDNEKIVIDFEKYIWESVKEDTELSESVSELKLPKKTGISSLYLSDGSLFVMKLDKKIQKIQLEFFEESNLNELKFFKNSNLKKDEVISIINKSLDEMQEKFIEDADSYMDKLFDSISIKSKHVIKYFINMFDSFDKSIRIPSFAKIEKAPSEVDVSKYKEDISNKIFFQYFVEEKQKLKKEFIKKYDKEFANSSEAIDVAEKLKSISEEANKFLFSAKDDKDTKTKYDKTCDKRNEFIKHYIDRQIIEIQKIQKILKQQYESITKNQDKVKLDVFESHYSSLCEEMKKFRNELDEIIKLIVGKKLTAF